VHASAGEKKYVAVIDERIQEYEDEIIHPILCAGDVIGAVILLEKKKKLGETEEKLAACAANFLGRQMEQ